MLSLETTRQFAAKASSRKALFARQTRAFRSDFLETQVVEMYTRQSEKTAVTASRRSTHESANTVAKSAEDFVASFTPACMTTTSGDESEK